MPTRRLDRCVSGSREVSLPRYSVRRFGSREVSLPKRRFRACCGSRVDSLPHTQITVVEFALAIVVCCDYGSREVSLP